MNFGKNALLYKYLRGSWAHGIAVEGKSDYDYGGVFLCPHDTLYALPSVYTEQISDAKSDEVYYEIGRWMSLLLSSNPTVLESLFVDEEFRIGEVNPVIQKIINNRDAFLTKKAFMPLVGYAFDQISKAQGYNKLCHYPENMERKGVIDFCYVPYEQGSKKIMDWLYDYGMKQKYCGLVQLPNMHNTYGVYYDWGTHFICEYGTDLRDIESIKKLFDKLEGYLCGYGTEEERNITKGLDKFEKAYDHLNGLWYYLSEEVYLKEPYGFTGIVSENSDSNDVRTCEVPKELKPVTIMSFNQSGYKDNCKEYQRWATWKKERNPIRYIDNKGYNFDAKNMCECTRLLHTGIELARGEGYNVKRTWDREMLLDIKNHKWTYDEIIKYVTDKKREFMEAVKTSTLPEKIDFDYVNNLLIECRKELYLEK